MPKKRIIESSKEHPKLPEPSFYSFKAEEQEVNENFLDVPFFPSRLINILDILKKQHQKHKTSHHTRINKRRWPVIEKNVISGGRKTITEKGMLITEISRELQHQEGLGSLIQSFHIEPILRKLTGDGLTFNYKFNEQKNTRYFITEKGINELEKFFVLDLRIITAILEYANNSKKK